MKNKIKKIRVIISQFVPNFLMYNSENQMMQSTELSIKAIIFDWGGVLIKNPEKEMMAYSAKIFNISKNKFREIYKKNFEEMFDKGKISETKLWKKISDSLNVTSPPKEFWAKALRKFYIENKRVIALGKNLKKKGYKIGLLSNAEKTTKKVFKEKGYDFFDVTIFSCDVGFIKPQKEIYKIILNKLGIKPQESVFIDNMKENIKAAKNLGINGILFTNYEKLKEDLHKLNVL